MNEAQSQYPGDVQFAGLVQAATNAADQEELWSNGNNAQINESELYDRPLLHDSSLSHQQDGPRKRKRGDSYSLPQGQYVPVSDFNSPDHRYDTRPEDAGAREGVASTLFREPSEKSKRYTRPPMSSLYTSLQLTPEHFLRLQATAKDYMLDENFPERQACVGQRGAGENSDLTKLKLWNCVHEFLDRQGYGERYWGHQVGTAAEIASRTLFWPEDSLKIIKLCVPLLRRMVTNERQRKYAAGTRKSLEKKVSPRHLASSKNPVELFQDGTPSRGYDPEDLDLLGEGSTPLAPKTARWSADHNHQELSRLRHVMLLDEVDFGRIVAAVDGHLENFHGGEDALCHPGCEQQAIDRLVTWLRTRPSAELTSVRQSEVESETFHKLFEACKRDAQSRRSREVAKLDTVQSSPFPNQPPNPGVAGKNNLNPRATSAGSVVRQAEPIPNGSRDSSFTLLVNLVHKDPTTSASRRVMPRFSLSPESATSLTSLRAEVQQRYNAVSPATATTLADTNGEIGTSIKVWLPDGLVEVKDDGEWMIALLSAEMVDWLDGEVRVIIEL